MISQEDIIKPLLFLDIFDYPPTAMEIWRFLGAKAELGDVVAALNDFVILTEAPLARSGGIALSDPSPCRLGMTTKNGCHFLPGREDLIEKRREFDHLSEKKFKIAKRAAWLLHLIPSIKMIAICNNFYYRPQSDIDFFIITKKNRLWLTRFFAISILEIFGLRARGKKTADKVCLSFYLNETDLNLASVTLKPDDPYFAYWLAFLDPIYGQDVYDNFWAANDWLLNYFPNIKAKIPVPRRRITDSSLVLVTKKLKNFWLDGFLGDWLEAVLKKIQWFKISPRLKEMAASGDTRVVINDRMLKFHENDRRQQFSDQLKVKIGKN